jgi:hypothetical protein
LTVAGRRAERCRGLLDAEPREVAHRHDLLEALVFLLELLQRLIERLDVDARFLGLDIEVGERHAHRAITALGGVPAPRMIDEDATHGLRGRRRRNVRGSPSHRRSATGAGTPR